MLESRSAAPLARRPPPQDVSVAEYLQLLWRGRVWLLAGMIAGSVVAAVVSWSTPRSYEATVSLIIANSKLGVGDPRVPALSVATVRELLTTRAGARRVVDELGLRRPPYSLTATALLAKSRVDEIRNTSVVRLTVRMSDPEMAATVANRLATVGIEQLQKSNSGDVVAIQELIKSARDEAERTLSATEKKLIEFRAATQLELQRKDAEALLEQRRAYVDLLVNIEQEKAWQAVAQKELTAGGRTRVLTLNRTIDPEGTVADIARGGGREAVLPLNLAEQQLDPVYATLEEKLALSRASLSALERRRSELAEKLGIDRVQHNRLATLYRGEIELGRLEAEHELAESVYSQLARKYEDARLDVLARSAELQVLDPAVAPDAPAAPRPRLYALLGMIVGFMAAVLGVTAAFYLTEARPVGERVAV